MQLAFEIENTSHFTTESIKYISVNYSTKLILFDTIEFALSFMEYYNDQNKNNNELQQILWNTVISLQYKKCLLWYRYACCLYKLYSKTRQYKQCQHMLEMMENHLPATFAMDRRQHLQWNYFKTMNICNDVKLTIETISQYYAYKIQSILQKQHNMSGDIVYETDNILKSQLLQLYSYSSDICKLWPETVKGFEAATYELVYNYAKCFLLLENYSKSFKYIEYVVVDFYSEWDGHFAYSYNDDWGNKFDTYTKQKILEYNILIYILLHYDNKQNDDILMRSKKFVERHTPINVGSILLRLLLKFCDLYNVYYVQEKDDMCFDEIVKCLDNVMGEIDGCNLIEDCFLIKRSLKQIKKTIMQNFRSTVQ
eukprot:476643_1